MSAGRAAPNPPNGLATVRNQSVQRFGDSPLLEELLEVVLEVGSVAFDASTACRFIA